MVDKVGNKVEYENIHTQNSEEIIKDDLLTLPNTNVSINLNPLPTTKHHDRYAMTNEPRFTSAIVQKHLIDLDIKPNLQQRYAMERQVFDSQEALHRKSIIIKVSYTITTHPNNNLIPPDNASEWDDGSMVIC